MTASSPNMAAIHHAAGASGQDNPPGPSELSQLAETLVAEVVGLQATGGSGTPPPGGEAAPSPDVGRLLDLLRRTASLLQAALRRQEASGQEAPQAQAAAALPEGPAVRHPSWEQVLLVAVNLTSQAAAQRYSLVLRQLESVKDVVLQQVDATSAQFQVWTTSQARLARGILTAPGRRPSRVQTSLGKVTVALEPEPDAPPAPGAAAQAPGSSPATAGAGSPHPATPGAPGPGGDDRPLLEAGVNGFFNARHYLLVNGEPGPVEMHSWQVDISWQGGQCDGQGKLVGFDVVQAGVAKVLAGYNNVLLNRLPPFETVPPTPENLARTLFQQIDALAAGLPLRLKTLKVWPAPTQYVAYTPGRVHAP